MMKAVAGKSAQPVADESDENELMKVNMMIRVVIVELCPRTRIMRRF